MDRRMTGSALTGNGEMMMADREKVIKGIGICLQRFHCGGDCPYYDDCGELGCMEQLREDALVLLNGQDAKERKWLQAIADNQIANAPKDSPMSLDEQLKSEYKSGIYDGLQMAFEILTDGR